MVGNLLSNAVKFTERGRVTLQVQRDDRPTTGQRPGEPELVFSVIDTGIGIAPENLAVIFGAFQQGDGTLSRRYGGTGLGLSIASQVSALLGGQITATSDLGRGSTFTLRVPATLPALPPFDERPRTPSPPWPKARRRPDGLIGYAGPTGRGGPGRPAPRPTDQPGVRAAAAAEPDEISQPLRAAMADITRAATSIIASGAGGRDDDSVPVASVAGAAVTGTAATVTAIPGPAAEAAGGVGGQDRNVLVFEGTSGGLLTLLAYSAISDLAGVSTAVRVSTAVGPSQGVAMLAAEPFRCVVVDLAMPTALEFLEQVQEKPELREVPVLALPVRAAGQRERGPLRGAALRVPDAGAAALAGRAPRADHAAPVGRPAGPGARVRRRARPPRRGADGGRGRAGRRTTTPACAASTCSSSTTTPATSSRSPARSSCTASR